MLTREQTAHISGRINGWLLPLLALSLPLSTSAATVLAILIFIFWMAEGGFREKLAEILGNSISLAVIAYLALHVIGLLWSEDIGAGLEMISRQWKLMLMPVFLTAISSDRRRMPLYFFLAGLTAIMLAAYLAWFDLLHFGGTTPEHPTRKVFHVVYNPMLAFGFYLVVHQVLWGKMAGKWKWAMTILALAMAWNMFITEGRAGQVGFFLMTGLLVLQYWRKNLLVALGVVLLLLPLLFAGGYTFSPTFQQRVQAVVQEVSEFSTNPATSIGMRLQFWQNSRQIIAAHPFLGVGTGDFQIEYARVNRVNSPEMPATDNPHNQYILVLSQFGLLGFALLAAIFFLQMRRSMITRDGLERIRLALPLLYLVIMMTESYLVVFETAFLFSLFSAILYKSPIRSERETGKTTGRCWLILSYRANIDGSACSQHIDDRLPFFRERGITPILLSGPIGGRTDRRYHFRCSSIAPSGIRFELRHFLRKRLPRRWQFKLAETVLLLPVFPLYLLEKIIINLESEWSWFFVSSVRGYLLCRRFRPEVIYSTGGTASAHVAAALIRRLTGLPWLAETQDPLVHDQEWRRGRMVLAVYKWLERYICANANAFIFLARAARDNMAARTGRPECGVVIHPGANPDMFGKKVCQKSEHCRFAHFGTLAGTRNLIVFLEAVRLLIDRGSVSPDLIRVDVYGSMDNGTRKMVRQLGLDHLVTAHGQLPRKTALSAMQETDCLILVQNTIFFSSETIPSKVYEYLLSGRPILGLVYNNDELHAMLAQSGNFPVPADDVDRVAEAMERVLELYADGSLAACSRYEAYTVAGAVDRLIGLGQAVQNGSCRFSAEKRPVLRRGYCRNHQEDIL